MTTLNPSYGHLIMQTKKKGKKGDIDKNHEIRLQTINTTFICTLKFITCLFFTFVYVYVHNAKPYIVCIKTETHVSKRVAYST